MCAHFRYIIADVEVGFHRSRRPLEQENSGKDAAVLSVGLLHAAHYVHFENSVQIDP